MPPQRHASPQLPSLVCCGCGAKWHRTAPTASSTLSEAHSPKQDAASTWLRCGEHNNDAGERSADPAPSPWRLACDPTRAQLGAALNLTLCHGYAAFWAASGGSGRRPPVEATEPRSLASTWTADAAAAVAGRSRRARGAQGVGVPCRRTPSPPHRLTCLTAARVHPLRRPDNPPLAGQAAAPRPAVDKHERTLRALIARAKAAAHQRPVAPQPGREVSADDPELLRLRDRVLEECTLEHPGAAFASAPRCPPPMSPTCAMAMMA